MFNSRADHNTHAEGEDVTYSGRIKLVLGEPQRLIRGALRALLETHRIIVVGESSDAPELLTVIKTQQPDVALIAIDGWGEHDFALLEELPSVAGRARTLVLTGEVDRGLHARAIELGAMGLVLKTQPAEVLVKAVQKVYAGELWLDRAQIATIVNRLTLNRSDTDADPEATRIESLTPRERQIVALVTEGLTNKDVAERLFISEATARNHLTSILDKLGLANRFQLAVYAFRRGLVFCPQTPAMLRSSRMLATAEARRRLARVSARHSA
jgi:two-component system, NarL family, nitrate/nitrite response regulator NarL